MKALSREDATLVTIVPPSGYAEELKAAAAAAAAGAAATAAGPHRPLVLRCCARVRLLRPQVEGACGRRKSACRWWRQEVVSAGPAKFWGFWGRLLGLLISWRAIRRQNGDHFC